MVMLTAPTNRTIAPTDKSMLPIRMTKLAPSDAISNVAASPLIAEKLRQLRNGGDAMPKNMISASTTRIGSQVPRGMLILRVMGRPAGVVGRAARGIDEWVLSNLYLTEVDGMLERAKETTRVGKYTYIE
jgi:hypothetical protein